MGSEVSKASLGGAGWGPSVEETVFDQLLPSATGRVEQKEVEGSHVYLPPLVMPRFGGGRGRSRGGMEDMETSLHLMGAKDRITFTE